MPCSLEAQKGTCPNQIRISQLRRVTRNKEKNLLEAVEDKIERARRSTLMKASGLSQVMLSMGPLGRGPKDQTSVQSGPKKCNRAR